MQIEVTASGPVFNGDAEKAFLAMQEEVGRVVAAQGSSNVHAILNARIQHPTPYYETQIITERAVNGFVVHDRDIVYGPWLEGTSLRNVTSSFKGYGAFRKAADLLRKQAPGLAQQVVPRYVARME